MTSSSASSPSIIAQLSAVGRSHSLPLEFITSLEYLYCNLQHKAFIIVPLLLYISCLIQINKGPCSLGITCVSFSRNSSWCSSAARQLLFQWKHQIWARNPETHKHWLKVGAVTLLRNTAVVAATRKWFSETQQGIPFNVSVNPHIAYPSVRCFTFSLCWSYSTDTLW